MTIHEIRYQLIDLLGLIEHGTVPGMRHDHRLNVRYQLLCFGHDLERAMHNVEILEKCSLAYLLALCTERKVSKIPFAVREIAFAKLRQDQKKVERGG